MENRFKLRLSRMFRSSFGSCRNRNISDVVERPVFIAQNREHIPLVELFSPKPSLFPSICRPKCSETADHSCIVTKELFPRSKVSDRNSLLVSADIDGRKCPPASPISPFNSFYEFQELESKTEQKKSKKTTTKKKKEKTHFNNNKKCAKDQFDSLVADNYSGWFSSDEDDEVEDDDKTTLFSSKSLTSDSSDSRNKARSHNKSATTRRRKGPRKDSEMGLMPLQGKVKDSFAVVKRSSDPYSDFRTSMVEMIVEKQIFAAKDLENLLQCFLSLNSYHHHRVIIEVFTDIWEALFSNWS